MSTTSFKKFDIKEGMVAFEIEKGKVNWQDNQLTNLVKLTQNGNFISLEKTHDNRLKFSYLYIEIGKASLELETSNLSTEQDYTVMLSWNAENRLIKLYINGELKGDANIDPID